MNEQLEEFRKALQESVNLTRSFPLDNAGLYAYAALAKHHVYMMEAFIRHLERYAELEALLDQYEELTSGNRH
jgi:hypothetical protein